MAGIREKSALVPTLATLSEGAEVDGSRHGKGGEGKDKIH